MFDRFTDDARKTMGFARRAALRLGDPFIGTEHILLGLVDLPGLHAELLARRAGSLDRVRAEVEREVAAVRRPGASAALGLLPFTAEGKRSLELAYAGGTRDVGPWELFLGIAAEEDGLGGKLVRRFGLDVRSPEMAAPGGAPSAPGDVPAQVFDLALAVRELRGQQELLASRLAQVHGLLRRASLLGFLLALALAAAVAGLLVR